MTLHRLTHSEKSNQGSSNSSSQPGLTLQGKSVSYTFRLSLSLSHRTCHTYGKFVITVMSKTRTGEYYGRDDTHLGYETNLKRLKYKHRDIFVPLPFVEQRPRVSVIVICLNKLCLTMHFPHSQLLDHFLDSLNEPYVFHILITQHTLNTLKIKLSSLLTTPNTNLLRSL